MSEDLLGFPVLGLEEEAHEFDVFNGNARRKERPRVIHEQEGVARERRENVLKLRVFRPLGENGGADNEEHVVGHVLRELFELV